MRAILPAVALVLASSSYSLAQTPVLQSPPKLAIPAPNYVTIPLEIDVDRPAAEVWKRIGKFCGIAEWFQIPAGCHLLSAKEGDVGSVRSVANEIMIGKTDLSYAYTQPVYEGRPYNLYHGLLEAKPLTKKTSKIVYTLMYDNSLVPGDAAAKAAEIQGRRTRFEHALQNMKILAEGGTLPQPTTPPAR